MKCITATLEDHNVASLETKSKCISSNVRACLIDDPDNTKRNSFLTDQKSVRTFFHSGHFTDRIFERHKLTKSLCHSFDSLSGKEQTVHQTFRHVVCLSVFYIDRIGTE